MGLVLPPSIAPVQIILVPVLPAANAGGPGHDALVSKLQAIRTTLTECGLRCHLDARLDVRPGAKFFEWERKGVPLRLVLGAKELATGTVTMVERVSGRKELIVAGDGDKALVARVQEALSEVQAELYRQAEQRLHARILRVDCYEDMRKVLSQDEAQGDGGGFFLVPWRDCAANELKIKEDCKATLRCFPYDYNQTAPGPGVKCFYSGDAATHMALFARAF